MSETETAVASVGATVPPCLSRCVALQMVRLLWDIQVRPRFRIIYEKSRPRKEERALYEFNILLRSPASVDEKYAEVSFVSSVRAWQAAAPSCLLYAGSFRCSISHVVSRHAICRRQGGCLQTLSICVPALLMMHGARLRG